MTPTQREAITWQPEPVDGIRHASVAALGWFGSGKSTVFALRLLAHAARNPWTEAYGPKNHPTTLVMAPTDRILRRTTAPVIEATFPGEIVLRRRGAPWSDWLLANGHLIVAWSAETPMEGVTVTGLFADEIQHDAWWRNSSFWGNCVARVRDPRSSSLEVFACGLPEHGPVRETFGDAVDAPTPQRRTFMFATRDNPGLAASVLEAIASATAYEDRGLLEKAGWRAPPGAVYASFNAAVHVIDRKGSSEDTTHLAVDCGPAASAWVAVQEIQVEHVNLVGQKSKARGLLVVDAGEAKHDDLDAISLDIRTSRPWFIGDRSTISVDPTLRRSELQVLRRHFPRARVVQADRDDESYSVEAGIANTRRCIRDALGNVSLYFSTEAKAAATAIQAYRYLPSGRLKKNSAAEHLADCVRYATCTLLPIGLGARGEARAWKR